MGKMTKTLFAGHREKASDILDLVHTDVCGLMLTQVRGEYSYFITFTDDRFRFECVYLMKSRRSFEEKWFSSFKYHIPLALPTWPYK